MTQVQIAKTGQSVEVDFKALPANSQEFIINYGLRQMLNDCHSALTVKGWEGTQEAFNEAVMKAVSDKLAAIASGDLSIRKAGKAEPVDPVERLALRMARELIKDALAAKKLTIKKIGEEKFESLVEAKMEKDGEALRKEAKAQLKRKADLQAAEDIDLSDLL